MQTPIIRLKLSLLVKYFRDTTHNYLNPFLYENLANYISSCYYRPLKVPLNMIGCVMPRFIVASHCAPILSSLAARDGNGCKPDGYLRPKPALDGINPHPLRNPHPPRVQFCDHTRARAGFGYPRVSHTR